MLFAIRITDKPSMGATRRSVRDAHIAYLSEHAEMLVLAGPIMDAEGNSIGSVRLVEAPDLAAAERLCAEDPFALAGCFAQVAIDPYRIVFRDGRLVE
ncbi:MAG: YciI family protein [Pseudomonadota bacterium]